MQLLVDSQRTKYTRLPEPVYVLDEMLLPLRLVHLTR